MTDIRNMHILFIAGQPKAGSTSVYDWLSTHPDYRPSRIKEARFFLDKDYPVPSGPRFDGTNLDRYRALFAPQGGSVLLDASPDYMFCRNFAQTAQIFPKARLVLLQRDPVDRLISWYRYAAQRGFLQRGATFAQFLEAQKSPENTPRLPVWQRAMDQNRFNHYAAPLLQAYGARAIVIPFDMLRHAPQTVMNRICALSGINPDHFDDFDFAPSNVTSGAAGNPLLRHYERFRAKAAYALPFEPDQMARLRPASRFMRRILSGRNPHLAKPTIDSATRQIILQRAGQ